MENTVICPVCGEFTFKGVDSQETCPVCGWVNDQYQTEHIFVCRGANEFCLAQQKKAWNIMENGEEEVGYGTDNLLWGVSECKLCHEKICMEECEYKVKQLMAGVLPSGVKDLEQARNTCTNCIFRQRAYLEDMKECSNMVEKPSGWYTYGNGKWGAGDTEYNVEKYQKYLKSLVNYCHGEQIVLGGSDNKPELQYEGVKDQLLSRMAEDAEERRNCESYFSRTILSVADFIKYATEPDGTLDYRFDLWNFGDWWENKHEFTPEEKKDAAKVLHLSLSFYNYKCDSFSLHGLYYLDNCYPGWEAEDLDDTVAAWFVDIGEDLDEEALRLFIKETLEESFAFSHIKLALHLMSHLESAKADPKLQKLLVLYGKVESLQHLVEKCRG